jgi:hypothetical protein
MENDAFFRFPHTPHLAWLGRDVPRDDKVLSPDDAARLVAGDVVIEEKLDGANLGLSLGEDRRLRSQNRGHYLQAPFGGQFARLPGWLAVHEERLTACLTPALIAFGEWCAAQHSLDYSTLPDWWLLFDIYDRERGRFWSTARRDAWAEQAGVVTVKRVARGRFDQSSLKNLLRDVRSSYRSGPMEGIVVRAETEEVLIARAKLVRADFAQSIEEHWRSRPLHWNRLGN